MATKQIFNGKKIFEPGIYNSTKSGANNPPLELSYGNVLIIDDGAGAGWGSGGSIQGELTNNDLAIQMFSTMKEMKEAVKGGILWKLAEKLFQPDGFAIQGVSKVIYVRAASTVGATITMTPTGGGAAGGSIVFKAKNEGLVGNAVHTTPATGLNQGYGAKWRTVGAKFVIDIFIGTFKGTDAVNGIPWDAAIEVSQPQLLLTTTPFDTLAELKTFCDTNAVFKSLFKSTITPTGTGAVNAADALTYAPFTYALGGTESYAAANAFEDVLDYIGELDYSFALCLKTGAAAYQDANLDALIYHFINEATDKKAVFVGGGDDSASFANSISLAADLNTERAIVVHGGYKLFTNQGENLYSSLFKTAAVLGRICGLEPQVPGTFKSIKFDADRHTLTAAERESALDGGVLHTKFDAQFGGFIINQSINTLQVNDFTIGDTGTSFEISVERIDAQLNKEIRFNAKTKLFGQPQGVNRNTLSAQDVKVWLEGFLQTKVSSDTDDNLLIKPGYENVVVETQQDGYHINFAYYPNFPVNKLFFTGFISDSTL